MTNYSDTPAKSIDIMAVYIYIFDGSIIAAFNTLLAIVIFLTRNLRQQKEYVIFAGNMIVDAAFGFCYFSAGLWRVILYYGPEEYIEVYNIWQCFLTPHSVLFAFITPGTGLISLVTSIDRFISVMFPGKYLRLGSGYAHILIWSTMLLVVPILIAATITAYIVGDAVLQLKTCVLNTTTEIFMMNTAIRIFSNIAGVLLYVPICRRIYQMTTASSSQQSQAMNEKTRKRFITMTITMVLITLNQLLLFTAVDIYLFLVPENTVMIFFVLNLNKGFVNIIIFVLTQKELRKAILQRFGFNKAQVPMVSAAPRTITITASSSKKR